MYYACAVMVFGGLDTTPLRSLISKMVEPMEYGKIFTFVGVGFSFAMIITNSVYQEIYAETVATFPGTAYLVGVGLLLIALVRRLTSFLKEAFLSSALFSHFLGLPHNLIYYHYQT